MTSRDATSIWALPSEIGVKREASDWALMLTFGAIHWPWLLKSLYGGRKREKAALLARLDLPADALPNLGSWKADVGLLNLIIDVIMARKPTTVVELGAGASSLVAARALQLVGAGGLLHSYDQHADFVDQTQAWLAEHDLAPDLKHAPLGSPSGRWSELWYELKGVPNQIDLLLIDGPPWTINPMVRGRAECLFSRIAPGGLVILDDAARPGERLVARNWQRDWSDFDWRFIDGIKGTLIGERNGIKDKYTKCNSNK